jgi:hypothetical protein
MLQASVQKALEGRLRTVSKNPMGVPVVIAVADGNQGCQPLFFPVFSAARPLRKIDVPVVRYEAFKERNACTLMYKE